ncbi:MAG: E3 binding domain-containing protein, partial [Bdellovibrionaceae bacterium]|nr:E3 binding domain-containing protein [Pseudobdellovibrionaceae bacterium]
MATKNVQLPELGEGVTEGELVKWLVKVGDTVKPDQPVAEMMTDKATVEVPSPFGGVVKEIQKKEGDVVEVGMTMLVLDSDAAASASAPAPQTPKSAPAPAAAGQMDVYPPVMDSRVLATPATRRMAREMGVDLNQVRGTGVAGRVTRDDVMGSGAGAVS